MTLQRRMFLSFAKLFSTPIKNYILQPYRPETTLYITDQRLHYTFELTERKLVVKGLYFVGKPVYYHLLFILV